MQEPNVNQGGSHYPTRPLHVAAAFMPMINFWAKQRGMSVTQFINTHLKETLPTPPAEGSHE